MDRATSLLGTVGLVLGKATSLLGTVGLVSEVLGKDHLSTGDSGSCFRGSGQRPPLYWGQWVLF